MTSTNGLLMVHLIGNDTNIKACHCAQGERERERERERKKYFALKSVQNATCTFLVFDGDGNA